MADERRMRLGRSPSKRRKEVKATSQRKVGKRECACVRVCVCACVRVCVLVREREREREREIEKERECFDPIMGPYELSLNLNCQTTPVNEGVHDCLSKHPLDLD